MADKKERKKYPPGSKRGAVRLSNKTEVSEAAGKRDIPPNTLQRRKQRKNTLPVAKSQKVLRLQREIKKLKKDLAEQKAVISMLKKVPAFFQKIAKKNKKAGLKPSGDFETDQEQRFGYGNWLFRKNGKGTAAEPWPTAEELWNDPKVQKIIQDHNKSVKEKNSGIK